MADLRHIKINDTTYDIKDSGSVTNVAYDTTNKKITQTIDTTVSDVVSIATIKTDMGLTKGDVGLGNVDNKSSATIRSEITSSNVTTALGYTPVNPNEKGASNGIAELDSSGKIPNSQLPAYVDDVVEYASVGNFPASGESGIIYIALDTNKTYRWGGTEYVEISASLALGENANTAYRGDRGKEAYDHAQAHGSAYTSGLYKITTNAQGHVTGATAVVKSDITGLGIPGSDTDTHRPVKVNGTQVLGNNDTPLDLTAGSNVTLTESSGVVTIAATDTTYESKAAASGGTDVSLVTTGEKAEWNAKTSNIGTITKVQANGTDVSSSGTANIPAATTSAYGVTELSSAVNSNSEALAATPKAVKTAYDLANGKVSCTTANVKSALGTGSGTQKYLREDGTWNKPPDTEYSDATQSAHGLMPVADKVKVDEMGMVSYGTCSTAADQQVKAVTLSNTNWQRKIGSIVGVFYTISNTYTSSEDYPAKLNVNNTGDAPVWYNAAQYTTGSSTSILGKADAMIYYMWSGTYWVWMNMGWLDGNTDTKVQQNAAITTNKNYPVILAYSDATSKVTNTVNKAAAFTYNPSTSALVTGGTVNGYTLAAACAKGVDTSIGSASSANLPTTNAIKAFLSGITWGDLHAVSGS